MSQNPNNDEFHKDAITPLADEKYETELDFISVWDELHYEPSDVYANGLDALFESGAFDAGEKYPRGV